MQAIRHNPQEIDFSESSFQSKIITTSISKKDAKRLRIKEFKSWSFCFGVVALLTGVLIYFQLGVTMESVTLPLFFISLSGLIYFISKVILFSNSGNPEDVSSASQLN